MNPNLLNSHPDVLIAWFDDLGSGNEDYSFLSNFHEGENITLPGVTWELVFAGFTDHYIRQLVRKYWFTHNVPTGPVGFRTGEHAFAAMKCWKRDMVQFIQIVLAEDPNEAKEMGRECNLREDWEVVKYDVMMAIQRSKYTLDRKEGRYLLETGDALLIEGTFWGDDIWGVDLDGGVPPMDAEGSNWLGTMIMARRAELRAQSYFGTRTRAGEKNAKTAVNGRQKPSWMK